MTAVAHAPATAGRSPAFAHQPALDGLRGVSVLLVLCFHARWPWMSGGYVGVSVFFTLSGFLITRLLLDEHDRRGRVNVVRFWTRRLRRLMPASLACLLGVGVLGTLGAFGNNPRLGRDLVGAVLHLANWFSLTGEASYSQQVLDTRSPLDHFWSLAIEEQFYWVWPLVMVAVMRRARPHRAVFGLAAAAILAAPLVAATFGPDAAYWATPARAAEILVGAALAAALHRRSGAPGAGVALLGVPAIAVVLWAAVSWPSDGGPAYRGWMPLFALASAALILAVQVRSPLRRVLAWRPLAALGVISYGVYLYHWPVFLLLDAGDRSTSVARFAIQLAVTLALAVASYRWLEHPIRRGAGDRRTLGRSLAVAFGAVVLVGAVGSFGSPDPFADPAHAASQLEPVTSLAPLRPGGSGSNAGASSTLPARRSTAAHTSPASRPDRVTVSPTTVAAPAQDAPAPDAPAPGDVAIVAAPPRPVRMLVVGDSTAWSVGDGLAVWAEANPDLASVTLIVSPGCGFVLEGRVPADDGSTYAADCDTALSQSMNAALDELRPDVVMLMATRSDVKDREWSPDEGPLTILEPRAQERIRSDYADVTEWILGAGAPEVVWIEPPVVRVDPAPPDEMTDPERIAALHAIIRDTAAGASDPLRVTSVDLSGWFADSGIDDREARPDGMHFEVAGATEMAERYLGPTLVNVGLGA